MARFLLLLAVAGVCNGLPMSAKTVTEYLALVPQRAQGQSPVIKWLQLQYPKGVSKAQDVHVDWLNASVPEIGSFFNLDMELGAMLSAKILNESLYVIVNKAGGQSSEGGCCADTLRIFSRKDGSFRDVDIGTIVKQAMPDLDAHTSHTFDVKLVNGRVIVFAMVLYNEPRLQGIHADAIVAFDVDSQTILTTADGEKSFNIFAKAGETLSGQDSAAAVFKIQYFNWTASGRRLLQQQHEEWHGNGVEHFVTNAGESLLAITHRMMSEAVIFKSPYVYKHAQGGGSILQRFGTPTQYTAKSQTLHYFGVEQAGAMGYITGGVHNVWYRSNSDAFPGKESISLFVNTASNTQKAYAVEFVLNLQRQRPGVVYKDTVFATEYKATELSFSAPAQGGARAIGNGVMLAMSGVAGPGLELADVDGNQKDFQYPTSGTAPNLYDPFCFVTKA